MSILDWIFIGSLFTVAVCDAELKLEAADGENVTISFKTPDLDRADQVKITFTRENQKNVIARYCRCADCGDCNVVETPGVSLRVEEGNVSLILLRVSFRNSGLYEAKIFGNSVSELKATLVVNKPLCSSTQPPRAFTPKPHSFSEHQWLYAAIIIIILGIVSCGVVCCFRKRRKQAVLDQGQEDREGPQPSQQWTVLSVAVWEAIPLPEDQHRETEEELLPAGDKERESAA